MGYYIVMIVHTSNYEEKSINYINKAIEYANSEKEITIYKYYIELFKGPDGMPQLYEKYFE